MNLYNSLHIVGAITLGLVLPWLYVGQDESVVQGERGVSVETRGPVHEAFAEPVESRPQDSLVVTKQPPEAINEMPSDQKPDEEGVVWIPGYWGWDEGRQDFLWVSGFWRVPPPDRQWNPGYWQPIEGGWQWVPGLWSAADQEEVTYLPPPPPSIDEGPSTEAPDENSTYVPGCWVYRENRYWWRPGFWTPFQPDWVWIPSHYRRSPFGYIFIDGFWDHPMHRRGLLFAPVVFAPDVLRQRSFVFAPQYALSTDFLLVNLFVFPRGDHYYFGDFYDARYARAGLVPWIDYRLGRQSYDPDFAHFRHYQGAQWERGMRDLFTARREGKAARPPVTLADQQEQLRKFSTGNQRNETVSKALGLTSSQLVSAAVPLKQVGNQPLSRLVRPADRKEASVIRLANVSADEHRREVNSARQFEQSAKARQQQEAQLIQHGQPPVKHTDPAKTVRLHPDRPQVEKQPPKDSRPPVDKQPPKKETQPPVEKQPPKKETQPPKKETQPPVEKQPPKKETQPPKKETPPPVEKQPPKKETQPPVQPQASRPRTPPPQPVVPKHEDRPIPKHEPPPPVRPPKQEQKKSPPPAPPKKEKG
jgi:hypothetical protein